jgi:hypothetical protein
VRQRCPLIFNIVLEFLARAQWKPLCITNTCDIGKTKTEEQVRGGRLGGVRGIRRGGEGDMAGKQGGRREGRGQFQWREAGVNFTSQNVMMDMWLNLQMEKKYRTVSILDTPRL